MIESHATTENITVALDLLLDAFNDAEQQGRNLNKWEEFIWIVITVYGACNNPNKLDKSVVLSIYANVTDKE